MLEKLKYQIYDILVETDDGELVDRIVAVMLLGLILINSAAVVLETVDEYNEHYGAIFSAIELVSVTIFAIEYLLRLWVAPLGKIFSGFIAFLGIGVFALPTGILASGFAEEISKRQNKSKECLCPHCGGDVASILENR